MSCWPHICTSRGTHPPLLSLWRSLLGLPHSPVSICIPSFFTYSKPWLFGNLPFLSSSTLGYEKVRWKYRAFLPPNWNLHMGVGFPWLHLVQTGPSFLSHDQNSLTEFPVYMAPTFSSQQFSWSPIPPSMPSELFAGSTKLYCFKAQPSSNQICNEQGLIWATSILGYQGTTCTWVSLDYSDNCENFLQAC